MKYKKGDIVDFKVYFFGKEYYWLGGKITDKKREDNGYTIEIIYAPNDIEIGQYYLIYFSEEYRLYEHDDSRFENNVSGNTEKIDFNKLANKLWDKHDYVVAILPSKEEDAKLGYTLGIEDGFKAGIEYESQRIKTFLNDWFKFNTKNQGVYQELGISKDDFEELIENI